MATTAAPADRRGRGGLLLREEHPLERVGAGRRLLLEPCRHGLRPILAEELLRALRDGQEPHDALLCLDDTPFPPRKLDAERLREATHDVEDQCETLGL